MEFAAQVKIVLSVQQIVIVDGDRLAEAGSVLILLLVVLMESAVQVKIVIFALLIVNVLRVKIVRVESA
jgi:hypothetical protein